MSSDQSFITHFDVSGSALASERARMRLIASNVANVNSTRSPDGGPYKRQFAILESKKTESALNTGVHLREIVTDSSVPRLVFDPEHPDADAQGYVAFPNVDILREVADMKAASMAYQANISVVNSTKQIISHAIDIGR